MQRLNLSRWAIDHAPLIRYLMVALMLIGTAAYFNLGQDEAVSYTHLTLPTTSRV